MWLGLNAWLLSIYVGGILQEWLTLCGRGRLVLEKALASVGASAQPEHVCVLFGALRLLVWGNARLCLGGSNRLRSCVVIDASAVGGV
mgnify:CR=1 FL=1